MEIEIKRDRLTVEQREKLKAAAKFMGIMTAAATFGYVYGKLVGRVLDEIVLQAAEQLDD